MFKLRASTGGVAGGSELEFLKNCPLTKERYKVTNPLDKAGGYSGTIMILLGCLIGSACSVPAPYSVFCGLSMPRAGRSFTSILNAAFVLELRLLRVPRD